MAEEQTPRPATFKEISALVFRNTTPEARQASAIAALGGSQSKRAREYMDLMNRLSARFPLK